MSKFKKNDIAIAKEFNFAWDKGQQFLVTDTRTTACCGANLIQIKSDKLDEHNTVCACKIPSGINYFDEKYFDVKQ